MSTKARGVKATLSHVDFFRVCEVAKANRDGIAQTHCWAAAAEFLRKKCHEQGMDLPVSNHSAAEVCKVLDIKLTRQRVPGVRRSDESINDRFEILARAIGRLYERLGEPYTPGLERLLQIARRSNRGGDGKQEDK